MNNPSLRQSGSRAWQKGRTHRGDGYAANFKHNLDLFVQVLCPELSECKEGGARLMHRPRMNKNAANAQADCSSSQHSKKSL